MGNKPGRKSLAGGGGGSHGSQTSSTGADRPSSASVASAPAATANRRRGSLSSTSNAHHVDISAGGGGGGAGYSAHPQPMASPHHTYAIGTVLDPNKLPHALPKHKPFHKWERDMLKSTFADLASRSPSGKAIDKETFLKSTAGDTHKDADETREGEKFMCNVPGILGERLFRVFNRSGSGQLDLDEFISGLAAYCRGTPELKTSFVYQMVNISNSGTVSRSEMDTMVNSFLFAAEAIRRHQSAAAAHSLAAEASVAQAAAQSALTQEQLSDRSGLSRPGQRAAPAPHALLNEHLRQMKNRAHSPSFQYSPPMHEAILAHALAAGGQQGDGSEYAATAGEHADGSANALGGSSLAADAASSAAAFTNAAGTVSLSPRHVQSPSSDPLSPHMLEPDWLHSSRVKEMVDDAFNSTADPAASATSSAAGGGSGVASSRPSSAGTTANSSSSTGDDAPGLSVYQFGKWLQSHPEILEVLDAAFVGGGLSYLSLNDDQQSAPGAPEPSGVGGGGAQSLSHRGSTVESQAEMNTGANPTSSRFSVSLTGINAAASGNPAGKDAASSPLSMPLSSPALGSLDLGASTKLEDKLTWKNGPRLSVSNGPPVGGGGSAGGAVMPTSTRASAAASSSLLLAPRTQQQVAAQRFSVTPNHGTAPAALFSQQQGQHAHHPFSFHCDHCGFDIIVKHCMACGKALLPVASPPVHTPATAAVASPAPAPAVTPAASSSGSTPSAQGGAGSAAHFNLQPPTPAVLPPTPSTAGAAATPQTGSMDFTCSHCSVPLFGCGTPRFCLCCGGDVRLASAAQPGNAGTALVSKPSPLLGGVAVGAGGGWARVPSLVSGTLPRGASSHHTPSTHVVEGYLKKVGARLKTIVSRWFVIRDNFLYSYTKPTDLRPAHVLFLEGCFVEAVNHEDRSAKLKYGIEIILSESHPGNSSTGGGGGNNAASSSNDDSGKAKTTSRLLYASSHESRQQWLDAIRVHANVHDIEEFYVLGPELGVGRFSSVREGVSRTSGRKYAVKIIDKAGVSESEREALRTEVAVLKLVHHPCIIRLKNVFETRKQIFIVMTFVRGGDLFDRLVKRKRFPEPTVQNIMIQLFQVVQYLHARGILHRDLKPENILLVSDKSDDQIMLTDFGLGAFALPGRRGMTLPCGTLSFTAPEVLTGAGYDQAVDLWSLGVILYLLLRGKMPFDGKSNEEIREKTLQGKVVMDDHPAWRAASDEVKSLIHGLLTVDPAKRISCQEALEHPWFKLKLQPPVAPGTAAAATAATASGAAATAAGAASAKPGGVPASPAAAIAPTAAAAGVPGAAAPASSHRPEVTAILTGDAATAATPSAPLPPLAPPASAGAGTSLSAGVTAPSVGLTPSATPPACVIIAGASTPSPVVVVGGGGATPPQSIGAPAAPAPVASTVSAPPQLRIRSRSPSLSMNTSLGAGAATPITPATATATSIHPALGLHQVRRPGSLDAGMHSSASSAADLPSLVVPGSAAASPVPIDAQQSPLPSPPLVRSGGVGGGALVISTARGGGGRANSGGGGDEAMENSPSSAMSPITILQYPEGDSSAPASMRHAVDSDAPSAAPSDVDEEEVVQLSSRAALRAHLSPPAATAAAPIAAPSAGSFSATGLLAPSPAPHSSASSPSPSISPPVPSVPTLVVTSPGLGSGAFGTAGQSMAPNARDSDDEDEAAGNDDKMNMFRSAHSPTSAIR